MIGTPKDHANLVEELSRLRHRVAELERIDIQREHAESALRDSEERYRRITAAITDYIYTVRVRAGRPTETVHGPACVLVTGYTAGEFAADPFLWIRMVPKEDQTLVKDQAARTLMGRSAEPIEHRLIRKDGMVRWVRSTQVPHFDPSGRLASYDGLLQDVTERKLAEEELARASHRNELILNSTGEGIYGLDLDGRITFVNPAAARMTRWKVEQLIGRDQHDTLHHAWADGAPSPRGECPICALVTKGTGQRVGSEVFCRRDGTRFPVEYIVTPIRERGKRIGAVVAFADVTKRRRAEREREELVAKLQAALAKVKTLGGLLPICASCKKIRNDRGYWEQIETYVRDHSDAEFSHGICPDCMRQLYPGFRGPPRDPSAQSAVGL